ncbi:MAG: 2-C-methyl-D-erythritol 2,4-cyclodiphosphate synthase [Actinomycetota bacterium]|nr:2-C-methyl-D-erythritol 2,4-cyclodiphosphate synthase [Actinomycetota bacterium]
MRVGMGFDIHPLSDDPARRLVLGGVQLPGHPGLSGHSDADVVAHAAADALLGAADLGDLGAHFAASDAEWSGADSIGLLTRVAVLVADAGWKPVNVDCSVVLDAPTLGPHLAGMRSRLSEAVGAPVAVKAKRAEGVGSLGRQEAVACWAVALVERP